MPNFENYDSLLKVSNVRWRNYSSKEEQIKFLRQFHSIRGIKSKTGLMKQFLWRQFFPMLSWKLFNEMYILKEIKSKKLAKLAQHLFTGQRIRGMCIFTAIAAAISGIAAACSSAAGAVAATAATVTSAIASSSVASAAGIGLVTGAATVAGEEVVKAIVK